MDAISEVFSEYVCYLEAEQDVRENILSETKTLEKIAWAITIQMEKIHNSGHDEVIEEVCKVLRSELVKVTEAYRRLGAAVPPNQFYRYYSLFRTQTQKMVQATAMVTYLQSDRLITIEESALMLGLKTIQCNPAPVSEKENSSKPAEKQIKKDTTVLSRETDDATVLVETETGISQTPAGHAPCAATCLAKQPGSQSLECGLYLDLEDYLLGCLALGSELSRLAVNAVSAGNYSLPFRINAFLRELHAAYTLLNFKNSYLRKTYDELKYSLKKTEEVVYNLSLRGLKPSEAGGCPNVEEMRD